MSVVKALCAKEAKAPFEPFEFTYDKPLGHDEVEIDVEYCGVCHTDISMRNNDWGLSTFPIVPGHEVIGIVKAIGSTVTAHKVGDRVGLGWHCGYCHNCDSCHSGDHNLCPDLKGTLIGRHGGFAQTVRSEAYAAIPVPEKLNPATAGPLLCAGLTVFAPMIDFGIKPTDTVGIVGVGGLGHMALKYSRAFGCKTVAFTSNLAKTDELKALGAHDVISSTDAEALKKAKGQFDFIMVTVNVDLDYPAFVECLKPRGMLNFVGVVSEVKLPVFPLIAGRKTVSGSIVGSPKMAKEMLKFSALHGIEPDCEEFPMEKVNEAVDKLLKGQLRFRAVLKMK